MNLLVNALITVKVLGHGSGQVMCEDGDWWNYTKKMHEKELVSERGFSFAGPATWNNLPNDLQHCSNTDAFKNKLKTFLFQRALNTD